MPDVDLRAKAASLGRDPDALAAMQCDECGALHVCSVAKAIEVADERPPDPSQQHGHHVHPDDPENDWICYGHYVEIDHPVAIKAFETRSLFGVKEIQLSKDDQLALGSVSRDERKLMLASGDFVRTAADPMLAVNAIDAQIAELQAQREVHVEAARAATPAEVAVKS